MFVEPRKSYRSVIQAIGRVLRHHPGKTLAHIVLPAVAVPAKVESEVEEAWSKALHHDLGGEALRSSGTAHGHAIAYEENAWPDQAFTDIGLNMASISDVSEGQSTGTPEECPCRPTPDHSRSGFDLAEDPGVTSQVKTVAKRGIVRKVEEVPERQEDLHDMASPEHIRSKPLDRAPSSSSSTWSSSSSASSTSLPSLEPASPEPTSPSDRSIPRGRQGESRKLWEAGPLAEPCVGQSKQLQGWEVSDSPAGDVDVSAFSGILAASGWVAEARGVSPCNSGRDELSGQENQLDKAEGMPTSVDPLLDRSESKADGGWSPAIIKEVIQQDTVLWEQLCDCNIGSASSSMEQQAARSSGTDAQWRGGPAPQIMQRVQLQPHVAPSDHNELCNSQLERFLSLLVQADCRLVGSSVGHRIQLVDCRMTAEGQEVDTLTEAVYKRLTTILRQNDPWEERLERVEEFVQENGKLPLRSGGWDEKRLGNWLSTQQAQLRAGLLLEHRWWRLMNSSSPLIRQRVQGWLSGDPDGKFKRRCLELKAYIEMNGELPRFNTNTSNSQSHHLALWLSSLEKRGGWTKPDRRAMLESLHPLVADFMAKRDSRTARIDLPAWQTKLRRLVACVKAKKHIPRFGSGSSDRGLYDWLYRNLNKLDRLPRELVKQLQDSHPLIGAKVLAAQAKQVAGARLKGTVGARA